MPTTQGVPWWRKALRRFWPIALSLAALFLAILGILVGVNADKWGWLTSAWYGWLLLASITMFGAVATYMTIRDAEAVGDLKDKVDGLTGERDSLVVETGRLRDDNRGLFETNLKHLADDLHFGYSERVTVYEYTDEGFQSIGRYSLNKNLRKPGRKACPINEGVIGLAWDGKPSFVPSLPDPHVSLDAYCEAVEETCLIPSLTCRKFKMKSRCLFGHCILDALGDGPVAVIVFESLTPESLDPNTLKAALHKEENRIKSYLEQRRTAPLHSNGGNNG